MNEPANSRAREAVALLIVLLACARCAAAGLVPAGEARIRVEHYSPEFTVCSVSVTGKGDSLIALNPAGQKLLWTQQSGRTNCSFCDTQAERLFTVEDADVVCRKTAGGEVLWRAGLPGVTAKLSLNARDMIALRDGRKPSSFVPEFWPMGPKILVPRDLVYWGGSINTLAGRETFLLDRRTGAVSFHRACGIADAVRESFRDGSIAVGGVGELRKKDLLRILEKNLWPRAKTKYRMSPSPAMIHPFRGRPASAVSWDHSAVIIDAKKGTEKEVVSKRPRYDQTRWALLPGFLIHYAESERPDLREKHGKTSGKGKKLVYIEPFHRWMDVYDAAGALVQEKENVMFLSRKGSLEYLGTAADGKAIFEDDECVHLLEVPSLTHAKRIAAVDINPDRPDYTGKDRPAEPLRYDVMGGAAGSDIVFCMIGNTMYTTGGSEDAVRDGELGVIFYDTKPGKTVWTYRQKVKIKVKGAGS